MLVVTVPAGLTEVHGKSLGGRFFFLLIHFSLLLTTLTTHFPLEGKLDASTNYCVLCLACQLIWFILCAVLPCCPLPTVLYSPINVFGKEFYQQPCLHLSFQVVKNKTGFCTLLLTFHYSKLHKCTSVSKIKNLIPFVFLFPGWIQVGVGPSPA